MMVGLLVVVPTFQMGKMRQRGHREIHVQQPGSRAPSHYLLLLCARPSAREGGPRGPPMAPPPCSSFIIKERKAKGSEGGCR